MSLTALLPIEQDTSRPSFTVKIGGHPLPTMVNVLSIAVDNEVNRIPAAYICIGDGDSALADWPVSNQELFVPGNEIEISAGYHGLEALIFKGIVTRHSLRVREGRRELNVECRDKAILLTITRNSNLYEEVKDSDVAATLLDSLAGEVTDTPVTHAQMVQYDVTDWDFIISRLESVGFVTIAHDGVIDIVKPAVESTAIATLRFGTNLIEFDAEIDGCQQYGSVKAQAWDPSGQVLLEAESNDPGWKTPGNLDPAAIGTASGSAQFILRQPARLSEEEVQQWADTKLLRSRMAFVCGRARVEGFSKAVPGITVALEGLGDRFNGMAWVSGLRHDISRGNWLVDLQLGLSQKLHLDRFMPQSPRAGSLLPSINGLHTATVAALEGDPDGEARIRVKIPSVTLDGDGSWARIATMDAGSTRGSVFLPEIDDEVIVGFVNDDPRQPVVLGSLFSSAKASPITASDDNHQKGFTTRSGMHIVFDDDKKTISIDTPKGNKIALDEEGKQISITDQNKNIITLSEDGITMESAKDFIINAKGDIKIEAKKGIEMKATMQLKGQGSTGVDISSTANTVIKGTMVQIN
ncbi:MAG: type VI secretion system tip protein VgrG [Chitinophagaceae bacterium]